MFWNNPTMLMQPGGGLKVEDVFSTDLYTGTVAPQTISNNIDLETEGGLIWTKCRNQTGVGYQHALVNTENTGAFLATDSTTTEGSLTNHDLLSDGYTINTSNSRWNSGGQSYVSWSFRRTPRFFDVVTYTGNGVVDREIPHVLGISPGMIVIKALSATGNWATNHRSVSGAMYLNLTNAAIANGDYMPTSDATSFTISYGPNHNSNGVTYVAYLFAHDPEPNGIIQCGSYTGNGSAAGPIIDLGWKPQYLLIKASSTSSGWVLLDTTRDNDIDLDTYLVAQVNAAEYVSTTIAYKVTSKGFQVAPSSGLNLASQTYIYMAIRAPEPDPVSAKINTSFSAWPYTGTAATQTIPNGIDLATDGGLVWAKSRSNSNTSHSLHDTERGLYKTLPTDSTTAEDTSSVGVSAYLDDGFTITPGSWINGSGYTQASWTFKKEPKFFDVVTYTGDDVNGRQITHGLGIEPGMILVKRLDSTSDWYVYHQSRGQSKYLKLNTTAAEVIDYGIWRTTRPNSTRFVIDGGDPINISGAEYVAYLFAHDPSPDGIIQCGSYTGNGTNIGPTVDLGWEPQYVMVKKSSGTGSWAILDSSRSESLDAQLLANLDVVEGVAETLNSTSTGFYASQSGTSINDSGATYIYMAIRKPTS